MFIRRVTWFRWTPAAYIVVPMLSSELHNQKSYALLVGVPYARLNERLHSQVDQGNGGSWDESY